jgi:hypothetical protein
MDCEVSTMMSTLGFALVVAGWSKKISMSLAKARCTEPTNATTTAASARQEGQQEVETTVRRERMAGLDGSGGSVR